MDPPRAGLRAGAAYYRSILEYERLSPGDRLGVTPPTPQAPGADYVANVNRVIAKRDNLLTKRAATLAALRIALFRAEHGRLPSTLDEAMTREQTLDPVSGEPFDYETEADGATHRLRTPPGATHVPDHERLMTARRAPLPAP